MKYFILHVLLILSVAATAQKGTFDLVTYTQPAGWTKKPAAGTLQLTKEDVAKGTYCVITLYKSMPASEDSKENFDVAWEALVKETLAVSAEPEMQPPATEDGWEVQNGYAAYETDGHKGVALLITSSRLNKMMNILILTNTDQYEKNVTAFLESISLKKPAVDKTKNTSNNTNSQTKPTPSLPTKAGAYAFTTTNFDDGWTSTVKEDWVEVIKGDTKVLLHYPTNKINAANTDVDVMCAAAWNVLVAPRYSDIQNYALTPGVLDYERPFLAQADVTEPATGKKVFVVLFSKGKTGWIEFVCPDRNSFIQDFGLDISKIDYYGDSKIWDPLKKMVGYNRFAVAASDFKGKWTDKFTGIQQYVNVYTGADAGMSSHSSSETFEFGNGGTYKWEIKTASGFVGNMKFQGAKSSGKLSVVNNWQVHFSDIEKRPKTYNAYFSCIKGTRILWLEDSQYPGYSGFAKME